MDEEVVSINLTLISGDNVQFATNSQVMASSRTITQLLRLCDISEQPVLIPLENFHSLVVRKLLFWAENRALYPTEEVPIDFADEPEDSYNIMMTEFDIHFFEMEQDLLLHTLELASFLEMWEYITIGGKKIASMLRNKTPDNIRQLFKIENDLNSNKTL